MEYIELPAALNNVIGTESRDFVVRAGSRKPFRESLSGLIFGIIWLAFTTFFISLFFDVSLSEMIAAGEAEQQKINPAYYLIAFFGIFYVVGFIIIGSAVVPLIQRGGYFVGTPERLIQFRNGKVRSIDWEQFTGNIDVRGNERKGTITMVLRTGRMIRQKGGSQYVPDVIFLTSIPEVFEVERMCRKRIRENDPTPASR